MPAEQVYDIEVEETHNFIGNGIVAHNTYINGNLGIGTTGPDAKLDSLAITGAQLRLTYADGTVYSDFTTNATGDLTITHSSGKAIISGDLTITGDDIFLTTNTIGALLVGDGTNFNPVVGTGDAEIADNGTITIVNDSHSHTSTTLPGTTSYLGSTIAADELASADFGLFSCNGSTCSADNDSITLATHTTGNYVATIADSGASEITVANSGTENAAVTLALAAGITRDVEWDTESEVQTAWGSVNILLETEIDASSELITLMDDETGTGYLVFSDSPTFITQMISPKLIGGAATTTDLYLQTTTGIGTTGADMHLLVGSNGATEAMTILNSGNVGIGTTGPSALLQVVGGLVRIGSGSTANNFASGTGNLYVASNIEADGSLYLSDGDSSKYMQLSMTGTTGTINVYPVGGTADTLLSITNSGSGVANLAIEGNVGIGTTGPAAALDVFKTTKQLQLSYDAVTSAQFTVAGSGILTILTDNSAAIAVTNGMTIGGNVGIGTTGPGAKLDVYGSNSTLRISDSRDQSWSVGDVGSSLEFWSDDNSGSNPNSVTGAVKTIAESTYGSSWGLGFYTKFDITGLAEWMRITRDGNVGIGRS